MNVIRTCAGIQRKKFIKHSLLATRKLLRNKLYGRFNSEIKVRLEIKSIRSTVTLSTCLMVSPNNFDFAFYPNVMNFIPFPLFFSYRLNNSISIQLKTLQIIAHLALTRLFSNFVFNPLPQSQTSSSNLQTRGTSGLIRLATLCQAG